MKKISICMTHYNRKKQLLNTLRSIQNQKDAKELTEIIIADDVSSEALSLNDFKDIDLDIKLISIQTNYKWWVNPCVAFDASFHFIHGEKVIIQNAECLHTTNIIQYVIDNLKQGEYVAMSALNLTKEASEAINLDTKPSDINKEGSAWYCHSKKRPTPLHFCAALNASDLKKIGGFDMRFSEGVWYDDAELLHSLTKIGIKIRIEDSQVVYHQWHESIWKSMPDFKVKMKQNKKLIDSMRKV